jgi:heme-degrading monooxygenase HmoA
VAFLGIVKINANRWLRSNIFGIDSSEEKMTIRVLMFRKMPRLYGGMEADLLPQLGPLLAEARKLAFRQPGYISGETMRNVADPYEFLVISTWKSVEDWERWFANEDRAEIEGKIDAVLGAPTEYRVYSYD